MKKYIIKTLDKIVSGDFNSIEIKIKKSWYTIKKNELYCPKAALLKFESFGNEEQTFCFLNPIIVSNQNGDIKVYTSSYYDQVVFKAPYIKNEKMEENLKKNLISYNKVGKLGLSIDNMIRGEIHHSQLLAHMLSVQYQKINNKTKKGKIE